MGHMILLGLRGWYRSTNRLASKTEGNGGQAGRVLSHVTPDSHPSYYFILLSKPNLILPVSHLSTDLTNEMPSALRLACLSSNLEQRRGT